MIRLSAVALALAAAGAAQAQGTGGLLPADIAKLVDAALPPIIGDNNQEILIALLQPRLGLPISQTFKLSDTVRNLFGRQPPVFNPDCQRSKTPVGETDPGECGASFGNEAGEGAYMRLNFSKNLGLGNFLFINRPPFKQVAPGDIKPVDLSNDAALTAGLDFLGRNFHVPMEEVPQAPAGATNPNPFVSDLALGFSPEAQQSPIVFQKLVHIPRGLLVELPDATGKPVPQSVPAPGKAVVAIDSTGVVGAMVDNWQELRVDPSMTSRLAKTRQVLIKEISEDLFRDGGGRIAQMSAHIVYGSDWRGSFGYLVPAVQVLVTPIKGDLTDAELAALFEQKVGTAGFIKEYSLVVRPDVPGR
jgi:hypothetical protein